MSIWHQTPDIDALNTLNASSINEVLGIRFINVDEGSLSASMPVDQRTHQPYGILHGGASVVLAESVGSAAANECIDPTSQYAVGQEINANHLRSVSSGYVTGTARPIHLGRTSHVWAIEITDDKGRLCCISRLTIAILARPASEHRTSTK